MSTREEDGAGTRTCTAPLVQRTAQSQHVNQRREGGGAETRTAPLGCPSPAAYGTITARQSVRRGHVREAEREHLAYLYSPTRFSITTAYSTTTARAGVRAREGDGAFKG